jgi:Na+-driven multidrug efflux pump
LDLRPEFLNRTILRLVWPAVTENLLFSAVFFADTLMVAWLRNESALAAAALVGVWMLFVNAPFFGLSIGASSLVSRSWGEHDFEAARRFAAHACCWRLRWLCFNSLEPGFRRKPLCGPRAARPRS